MGFREDGFPALNTRAIQALCTAALMLNLAVDGRGHRADSGAWAAAVQPAMDDRCQHRRRDRDQHKAEPPEGRPRETCVPKTDPQKKRGEPLDRNTRTCEAINAVCSKCGRRKI